MKKLLSLTITVAICAIGFAQNTVNIHKVSAHLAELSNQYNARQETKGTHAVPRNVNALVTLTTSCYADAFFDEHGCRLIDSVGRIYIVSIPLNKVAALSYNDTIERIEAERMPRPAMEVTPQQVNASAVYAGNGLPQAYTGAGVVAGVFDCYYDFTHPAFLDSTGNLRVKYYYDFHWQNADSTYGHALENAADIAAYEHSQHTRNGIHGTHVAGIMAGSAVEGQYQGMAPDADIYIADFNSDRDQFANPDENTSATAVLGFKYIFDHAQAEEKPCVINFSSCESIILTSQRTLEGEALQQLVGPGRIIVAAAGNDGTRACYLEKGADDFQAGTGIENGLYGGQTINIDLVTSGNQLVRFDFFGMGLTGGGIEGTIMFNTDSINAMGSHFTTTVSMGDILMDVTISPYNDPRGPVYHIHGTMPNVGYLYFCGATVLLTSNNPAWMYSDISFSPFRNVENVAQYSFAQPGYSVSWPSILPSIIAVGATGYKSVVTNIYGEDNYDMLTFAPDQVGQITKFSSCGPTFDGHIKPDVVAPGMNINAAYNSFYNDFDDIKKNLTHRVHTGNKDYYYLAESGTSMASPVVAGVIALWLQAKPDLTPAQALDVIRRTSTHPDGTMEYPNNTYGHGQIDAYRGLLEVLNLPVSIPNLSQHQPQNVIFRLENRRLYADFSEALHPKHVTFNIYRLNGQLVMTQSGRDYIDLSRLKGEVYAVQLITDSKATTGSTLIRLP